MSPDDLERMQAEDLKQRKAGHLERASYYRSKADEAQAGGDVGIAKTLRLLAANQEAAAALAVAERRDRAARAAKARRTLKNRETAKLERPGRRPALLDAMRETLGPLKREGVQFKTLMQRWGRERIGSLRLEDLGGGRYAITDEEGDDEARAVYTWGTLEKHYSKSQ